ncbi:SLAM family member 9-like isoform X2 [Erpetoichthys calabaricus]|uniref:SLAM family member 9-like isoform X2 n=1 Tax=Erpetoichthys calabaricus TaxID=27687 RepID=UPI00109EEAA8|nr:SLAM family member 9-like isoform X2 [Erpetoichthys calabaricus]
MTVMSMKVSTFCILSIFMNKTVCLAEIREVYRPTGKIIEMQSMLTEKQKLSLEEFKWCFGKDSDSVKIRIVKHQGENIVLAPNFKFKAEYRKSDFVLLLKNLTTEDTGIYTASFLNNKFESTELISYKLFLQDPVQQLSNKDFQILNSDGSCNITLNCSVGAGTEVTLKWMQIGANESLVTSHNAARLEYSAHYRDGNHVSFTCFAENKVSNLSLTTRNLCEPDMHKDESDANTVYAGIAEVNEQTEDPQRYTAAVHSTYVQIGGSESTHPEMTIYSTVGPKR